MKFDFIYFILAVLGCQLIDINQIESSSSRVNSNIRGQELLKNKNNNDAYSFIRLINSRHSSYSIINTNKTNNSISISGSGRLFKNKLSASKRKENNDRKKKPRLRKTKKKTTTNRRTKFLKFEQQQQHQHKRWSLRNINLAKFNCGQNECYPSIGDLLLGRKKYIYASSTCGLEQPTMFCKIGGSKSDSILPWLPNVRVRTDFSCDVCDSAQPYDEVNNNTHSHRIENIVFDSPIEVNTYGDDVIKKWWQSENGRHRVFIQFDLESEFTMTHVIMKFKTYPPASMIIEKSSDFGRTWRPLAYYSNDCEFHFPNVPRHVTHLLNEPFCTSKYSTTHRSSGSELLYRPLSRFTINKYSSEPEQLEKQLKMTNFRINFTQLIMQGDQNIERGGGGAAASHDASLIYYYAISELRVFGSCFCNGHGKKCDPLPNVQYDMNSFGRMIGGQCACEHNTMGTNCEKCMPLYNDLPWRYGKPCKRCECNDHATVCHYDKYLTRGVCDNCQHNTEGPNCDRCKPNYYHDTSKPMNHVDACKKCKCDNRGTSNLYLSENGVYACNSEHCRCKKNVEGDDCDVCKDGFFSLDEKNPDGCQACPCKKEGTVGNRGCDKDTGKCYPCKTNVIGEKCDTCANGYYGLNGSDSVDDGGCRPCDCSPYGSYSEMCNQLTGQCSCKPHTSGRQCDQIMDGYFCPSMDYLTFEAEYTNTTSTSFIHEDESSSSLSGNYPRWTGTGFLRVYDNDRINFRIDHAYASGYYSILMRHDQYSGYFDEVKTKIIDLGVTVSVNKQTSPTMKMNRLKQVQDCNKLDAQVFREKSVYLNKNTRSNIIFEQYCFKQNHSYDIQIFFHNERYKTYYAYEQAPTVLVDSIVIVPEFEHATAFKDEQADSFREKFFASDCHRNFFSLPKYANEECDRLACSITTQYFGILPCQCDPSGSLNSVCNKYDGACPCKMNVIHRVCDRCRQGSWGFGLHSEGCQACNCNPEGSMSFICNNRTGDCPCYDGKTDKMCDKCLLGFYGFPDCRPCACNGFSDFCDADGTCIGCKQNTDGRYCEHCKMGYFGDPLSGIECKRCACPQINGNNFAANNSCLLDAYTKKIKCNCLPGYTGDRCDKCDLGYFGNPLTKGGACKKCDCNNNTNPENANDCDRLTGKCLNCLFYTSGDRCERCKPGYFGSALLKTCKPCKCNAYGTDGNYKSNCDHETGTCSCLPKVIGEKCDECAADHWNLKSGKGCIMCDCDTTGTIENSTLCDENTGRCQCELGRGGRTCSDCQQGYYGSPQNNECKPCNCNLAGSESEECDKHSGQCKCKKGIVGRKCGECARGFIGTFPNCKPCGECFNGWDQALFRLNSDFERIEFKSIDAYFRFVPIPLNMTEFNFQYETIKNKIEDIYKILAYRQERPDKRLFRIKTNLTNIEQELASIRNVRRRFNQTTKFNAKPNLETIKESMKLLNKNVTHLLEIAFNFRESWINGAAKTIQSAFELSENASKRFMVELTRSKDELGDLSTKIESLTQQENNMNPYSKKLEKQSAQLKPKLIAIRTKIIELNSLVCGGPVVAVMNNQNNCELVANKCGSIECNKCGYFDESRPIRDQICLNGTESILLYHEYLTRRFNKTYEVKEKQFKSILERNYGENSLLKMTFDDLVGLNKSSAKVSILVTQNKNFINELYVKANEMSDNYHFIKEKLDSNIQMVLGSKFNLNEDEFGESLDQIKEITSTIKSQVEKVKLDTKLPFEKAESLKNLVNEHERKLKRDLTSNLLSYHANLKDLSDLNENMNQAILQTMEINENIIDKQQQTNRSLINAQTQLDVINMYYNEEFATQEILSSIELDKNQTVHHLTVRLAQSQKNLDSTTDVLSVIADDLQIMNDRLNEANTEESQKNLNELIDLQMKIIEIREALIKRKAELESKIYERANILSGLSDMRRTIDDLKSQTEIYKKEIRLKSNFIESCH